MSFVVYALDSDQDVPIEQVAKAHSKGIAGPPLFLNTQSID